MCGRFTLTSVDEQIADLFDVLEVPSRPTQFNIAPTQSIVVITQDDTKRRASLMRWGLVPSWAERPDTTLTFNARAETIREKPTFRRPFERRRCLIPADGFYEWRGKQPFRFVTEDRGLFAFAGLWDRWESPEGDVVESATIITTSPNQMMGAFHDRMPVILPTVTWQRWLRLDTGLDDAAALLVPCGDELLSAYAVDPRVGNVAFEDARALEKSEVQGELF